MLEMKVRSDEANPTEQLDVKQSNGFALSRRPFGVERAEKTEKAVLRDGASTRNKKKSGSMNACARRSPALSSRTHHSRKIMVFSSFGFGKRNFSSFASRSIEKSSD